MTAVTPGSPKGNPVLHAAVAPSPAPAPEHTVVSVGGAPLYSKAPGTNAFIDNTTVTLYGHVDLSGDVFNPGVYDQGTKLGVSSNLTYFGVRARHNLEPYGMPGWAAVAQFESLVEVAAVPTERAAFGTRDSFLGMESPWGTIKAGKADTPYKKATAKFDPFSATQRLRAWRFQLPRHVGPRQRLGLPAHIGAGGLHRRVIRQSLQRIVDL